MEPFTRLTAAAVPLLRDNIDTDAIIPSREMKSVSKQGLADGLFAGWRYLTIGGRDPDPAFVLNNPRFGEARILVAGANFGCGSSREHAVWALHEFGFRAVIAPSFNPIFRANCIANGIAPVVIAAHDVAEIGAELEKRPGAVLTVDMVKQKLWDARNREFSFSIEPEAREALLAGLDSIDLTLQLREQIEAFRFRDREDRPWIYTLASE